MDLGDLYQLAGQLWVVWLVLLFAGIMVWTFLPRNQDRLKSYADLPLNDDAEER